MTEERISARQWAKTMALGLGELKCNESVLRLMTKYYTVRVYRGGLSSDNGPFLCREIAEKTAAAFAVKDGVDLVEIKEEAKE